MSEDESLQTILKIIVDKFISETIDTMKATIWLSTRPFV